MAVGAISVAMAAVTWVARLLPLPETVQQFRIAAYGTHLIWFGLLVAAGFVVARSWNVPRASIATATLVSLVLAVLGIATGLDALADVAKAWFGALAGVAFARIVERPWWLLPIAVCVPLADAWSVYSSIGVTHAVLERAREEPRWIEWPTIATPIAGLPYESFGRLGIVDVLFASLFLGAAVRWRLGVRRVAAALVLGLLSTSVLVLEVDEVAVPALPLLCLAFLVACAPALLRDLRAASRGEDPTRFVSSSDHQGSPPP